MTPLRSWDLELKCDGVTDIVVKPVVSIRKTRLGLHRLPTAIVLIPLVVSPIICTAATRAGAVKTAEAAIWSRWVQLPADYQNQKRQGLKQFLGLLSSTNAAAFEDLWDAFVSAMGPTFAPLRHHVIEAMKVAEAFEAGFPNPEQRLPAMGDALLDRIPTNALFFTEADLVETVIVLQQEENRRRDVTVFNATRILDPDYLQIALDRAGQQASLQAKDLVKSVMQETLRRRQATDQDSRDPELSDGQLRGSGPLLLTTRAS